MKTDSVIKVQFPCDQPMESSAAISFPKEINNTEQQADAKELDFAALKLDEKGSNIKKAEDKEVFEYTTAAGDVQEIINEASYTNDKVVTQVLLKIQKFCEFFVTAIDFVLLQNFNQDKENLSS